MGAPKDPEKYKLWKEALSESHKGKDHEPWNKGLHLPGPMEGKKHTPEAIEKMRQKKLQKASPGMTGKHHSEESNQKNREKHLGKPAWNKGIDMPQSFCDTMSRVQKNKKLTWNHRKNVSIGMSRWFEAAYEDPIAYVKWLESHGKQIWASGQVIDVKQPKPPRYCMVWREVNPRVHAFFDYKCVLCGEPEKGRSHIGHHVFYVKEACCWYDEDGQYFTNLNARNHPEKDYFIGENPNYFVILCLHCHGETGGNFENRKKWADYFKNLIDTYYGGKCFLTKDEMAGLYPPPITL